jgi:hypothetical protein
LLWGAVLGELLVILVLLSAFDGTEFVGAIFNGVIFDVSISVVVAENFVSAAGFFDAAAHIRSTPGAQKITKNTQKNCPK